MRIETLPVAVALSLAAATVQAQQAMDHSGHAGHDAPMQQMPMDHGQTDHGAMPGAPSDRASTSQESMDHGSHGSMTHPPATGIPPGEASRAPVPEPEVLAVPASSRHTPHRGLASGG